MKAVVFHGIGDIRLDDVAEPKIEKPTDAIVRLTVSAICGTDLHMVRGTMGGIKPGTVLGHEGVGIVEEVGTGVRNLNPGDRVVVPSTVACGHCSYCRAGYYAQCDNANPKGAGTAFFGGPEAAGGFNGMQAEYVRVPFANIGLVRLPDAVSDDQAILVNKVKSRVIDPLSVLTQREPLSSAIEAYKSFDKREAGWMKVALTPTGRAASQKSDDVSVATGNTR